jgi:hypothetical protein
MKPSMSGWLNRLGRVKTTWALTGAILGAVLSGAGAFATDGGYLFVTFKGEQSSKSEQIHFAVSQDGRRWEALNGAQPVLVSEVGERGVRDPYLLRSSENGKNDKFYLVATDLSINHNGDWGRAVHAGSKSLVIWDSIDLTHWSAPRLVKVAPDDAGCAWAPEAIYDEGRKEYLVYWASTTASDNFKKHRIWAAWTRDFVTFGKPFVYMEKPWTVIDADIVREHGKLYRFAKDEEYKSITMEVSDNLAGPWKDVPSFSLAKVRGYEGPECYQIQPAADGKPACWCLILDQYSKGTGYQPFVTTNLSSGRFASGENFSFPFRFRHGSILPVSPEELGRLRAAFGSAK